MDGLPNLRYARDTSVTGAELHIQSEGGVLRGFIGYRFGLSIFEDAELSFANSFEHHLRTGMYWAFLPQTGLVYEGTVTRGNFPNRGDTVAATQVSNHWRLRQEIGVNGVVARPLSLTFMVGYSAGLFAQGDDYGIGGQGLTLRLEGALPCSAEPALEGRLYAPLSALHDRQLRAS